MTSDKTAVNPQITKTTPVGQNKKVLDRGKAKPQGKIKKNVVKLTPNTTTTTGPSANLQSQLRDKAKHTAALIQEITDELQAIEEESSNEQDSEATQESDLEHEDSDDPVTDGEQWLCQRQDSTPCTNKSNIVDEKHKNEIIETNASKLDINHAEEVIIGTEQGTTFPTKIGTLMCKALIDTGATRSCTGGSRLSRIFWEHTNLSGLSVIWLISTNLH